MILIEIKYNTLSVYLCIYMCTTHCILKYFITTVLHVLENREPKKIEDLAGKARLITFCELR
jgi:hypothetical protein